MSSKATKCGVVTQTGGKAPRKALAVWSAKRGAPTSGGLKKEKGVRVAVTVAGGDGQTRAGERERKRKAGGGGGESAGMRKRTVESIMTEGAEGVVEKERIPSSLPDTGSESEGGRATAQLMCSERMCAGDRLSLTGPSRLGRKWHEDCVCPAGTTEKYCLCEAGTGA